MHTVKALMERLDRGGEYPACVDAVRAANKQERSLMKMLDEARW